MAEGVLGQKALVGTGEERGSEDKLMSLWAGGSRWMPGTELRSCRQGCVWARELKVSS